MEEIERKFLVNSNAYRQQASKKYEIVQGFLNRDPDRTVRVRIKGDKGYLTVKGMSNSSGTSRAEWETEIKKKDAKFLLTLCEEHIIEKLRYEVKVGIHIYEVDEFHGVNEGLVLAEIELRDEDEFFKKPNWLSEEVTGTNEYYNSQLSIHPYKEWLTS